MFLCWNSIIFNEDHWFPVDLNGIGGISLFHPFDRNFKWNLDNFLMFLTTCPNFFFSSNWASILIQQKFQNVVWSRFWSLRLNLLLLFQEYIPPIIQFYTDHCKIIINFNIQEIFMFIEIGEEWPNDCLGFSFDHSISLNDL